MAVPVLRASLKTAQTGASTPTALSCHKIVLSYCDKMASSQGLREFLAYSAADFARAHPSVEFVVQPNPHKQPLVRGLYGEQKLPLNGPMKEVHTRLTTELTHASSPSAANGRDKTICVRELKPHQVAEKVRLALDASGRKATNLHRQYPVQSTNTSVRGIFSPFHQQQS